MILQLYNLYRHGMYIFYVLKNRIPINHDRVSEGAYRKFVIFVTCNYMMAVVANHRTYFKRSRFLGIILYIESLNVYMIKGHVIGCSHHVRL